MSEDLSLMTLVAHGVVQRTLDDSYVVLNNTYHVPKDVEEFHILWEQIDRWATSNPDKVTQELPPPGPTEDELQAGWAAAVRSERDARISATDYLIMPDYPAPNEATRASWMAYRQALRDITGAEGFPWTGVASVPWPVAPAPIKIQQEDSPAWLT